MQIVQGTIKLAATTTKIGNGADVHRQNTPKTEGETLAL